MSKAARRKTALAFIALSLHALLLSGCWDSTEVNDLAVITAIGIDLTEDRNLELTVKIYLISPASSQQSETISEPSSGGSGRKSVARSAEGFNMADAASKLQQMITRRVFWGQAEVILFGQRLAEEGLADTLDYLLRHPAPRERANVFVAEGSAKEALLLNPQIERSIADALQEMAEAQTGLNITLKELAQMLAGRSGAAVLPIVKIDEHEEEKTPFTFIQGAAILKDGKMIGSLDDTATRGILWLRNEIKQSTVTVTPEESPGSVSVRILRNRTELIPHIREGDWSMTVRIEAWDEIADNTTNLDLSGPKHIGHVEKLLEADINRRILDALEPAQKEMKADIFQFAEAFYRKYPKEWNRNGKRWDEIFPNMDVKLETHVKIERPGLVGKNIFKKEQR